MALPDIASGRRGHLTDARVVALTGHRKRVLDLGSGSGARSAQLEAQGCQVISLPEIPDDLGSTGFDVILAVDTLPGLAAPEAFLARLAPALDPGGYLVVTVPNVAHARVRLAVLGGSLPFPDGRATRFFTRTTLVETLKAAGFTAPHLETVEADIDDADVPFAAGAATPALLDALRSDPDARACELIAVAFPDRPALDRRRRASAPARPHDGPVFDDAQLLYLDLLKRVLARDGFPQRQAPADLPTDGIDPTTRAGVAHWLGAHNRAVVHRTPPTEWPVDAETMLTMPRLDSLVSCVGTVVGDGVPGDLIETGVWRGGACILMRAALKALGDRDRTVWVADSFQGLPRPDPERYPADDGDLFWTVDTLAVPLGDVMANFERYGLLDDQVRFLPGWFEDTLPAAPIDQLAVLRLDGDMYASTMQALESLYPKLSVGGFAIIDDFGAVPGCRAAVSDYRAAHGIDEPLVTTDYTEVLWRKER